MDPPAPESKRTTRGEPATGRSAGKTPDRRNTAEIASLSRATDAFARTGGGRRTRTRISVAAAILASILVGAALALAGRFEYRCAATWRITDESSPSRFAYYRTELLGYVWDHAERPAETDADVGGWFVDSPASDLLRLRLITHDRRAGVQRVEELAGGYRNHIRKLAATIRETRSEPEEALVEAMTVLAQRVDEARSQVDAAIVTLPDTDPSQHLRALLDRWQNLRAEFDGVRTRLSLASTELANLTSEPDPTHGVVTADQRRAAIEADKALQQDLHELAANLTELKLHLLTVWQASAGPLERLVQAADELVQVISTQRSTAAVESKLPSADALVSAIIAYRDRVERFSAAWDRLFVPLRELDVDPLGSEVIDIHQQARRVLNDHLFDASRLLSGVRSLVRELGQDPSDTARHHVLRSRIVRAFQTLQSSHHSFEFATGALDTPENFRLDAATKSAYGLRRRTRSRIRDIEQALQKQAAARARERHQGERVRVRGVVQEVRTQTDRTMDDLLALQEELNLSTEQAEEFYRAALQAEVASARMKLTEDYLTQTRDRLSKIATQRMTSAARLNVEIVSFTVDNRPVNLGARLKIGGLGAGLTLVTLLLGQWWITRRIHAPLKR